MSAVSDLNTCALERDALRADLKEVAVAGREVADMCEAVGWRCHGYRLVGLQEALARPGVQAVLGEEDE